MADVISTILGATQAGSLVAIIWLVVKVLSAKDAETDARIAVSGLTEQNVELQFRLTQVQQALDAVKQQAAQEAKELQANDSKPINTDLAAGDLAGRLDRMFSGWAANDAAAHSVASGTATVSPATPAASPGTHPG